MMGQIDICIESLGLLKPIGSPQPIELPPGYACFDGACYMISIIEKGE